MLKINEQNEQDFRILFHPASVCIIGASAALFRSAARVTQCTFTAQTVRRTTISSKQYLHVWTNALDDITLYCVTWRRKISPHTLS